jgi:hypothetical protein
MSLPLIEMDGHEGTHLLDIQRQWESKVMITMNNHKMREFQYVEAENLFRISQTKGSSIQESNDRK